MKINLVNNRDVATDLLEAQTTEGQDHLHHVFVLSNIWPRKETLQVSGCATDVLRKLMVQTRTLQNKRSERQVTFLMGKPKVSCICVHI